MEPEFQYDLYVIGGGSGGLACAKAAAGFEAKVAIADFVKPSPVGTSWGLGGTCVNVGCIPKKLMHFSAQMGESQKDQIDSGWQIKENHQHDWKTLVEKVQLHIKKLNWGYKVQLNEKHVTYHNKLAKIIDPHTIQLTGKDGIEEKVTAKYILICVGGRPQFLSDIHDSEKLCITSDDLFSMKNNPGKTLIVGASYIALECAGFLAAFGNDVTILVRSVLLRGFDQEISNKIGEFMAKHKVKFIREAVPSKITMTPEGKRYVQWVSSGKDKQVLGEDVFDTVLLAVGRQADTKNLGLDEIGIKYKADNGKIICNDNDSTSIENIFALGDCALCRPELTPTAVKAGKLLAARLFNFSEQNMDYIMIPTTVFTPLEYGCIGYSEEDAKQKFGQEDIRVYHTVINPLEWSFNEERYEDRGYGKLICKLSESQKVIGFHYLGPHAGEVTQGYAVALKMGATYKDFKNAVGIHPTNSEEMVNLNVAKGEGEIAEGGC